MIFQNFSQSLAICFELFSFGVIFNSEITNERAPPVRRRAPLSRQLASPAPPSLRQRPHSRRSPHRLVSLIPTAPSLSERHDRRCPAASAVVSTTSVSVARALLSPFFIRGVSISPSPPSSLSQDHRRPP
jgi:hypothetical protein